MYKTGTGPAADSYETAHRRLFRLFRQFLTGAPIVGTVGYVGTGNGVIVAIDTKALATPEVWTIAMTSATAFTVTGSVSGAQTSGTTGTNYTSNSPAGNLSFRINVGGTAFVAADAFTVPVGITSGSHTVDFRPGRTITRAAGSFVTNLFEAGDTVVVTGANNSANNGTFTLSAVSALVLTVNEDFITEAGDTGVTVTETIAPAALTIDFNNAGETATRASGSFITDGFKVGASVVIAGAVDAGNNGTKTLTGVSALVLTFTGGDITDDETGDTGVTFVQTVTSGSLTLDFKTANTSNRSSGSYITDGFEVGMNVAISGAVDGGNNATFAVSRVGALELKLATTIADETADTGVLIKETRAGNDSWIVDRYDPFEATLEFIGHGVGLAAADAVYIGIRCAETPASTIYTWEIQGQTGYASGNSFATQPGVSGNGFMAFHPTADLYWFVWNGRRAIAVHRASTTYHSMYAGFFLPYALPSEFPYPMYVSGCNTASYAHTSAVTATSAFFDPEAGQFRETDGTWRNIDNTTTSSGASVWSIWPYDAQNGQRAWLDAMEVTAAGEFVLFPIIVLRSGDGTTDPMSAEPYGSLDGVYGSGFFNGTAEQIVTVAGVNYMLVQNVFRTARANYCALKLA